MKGGMVKEIGNMEGYCEIEVLRPGESSITAVTLDSNESHRYLK